MRKLSYYVTLFYLLTLSVTSWSQEKGNDDGKKKTKLLLFPAAFFSPETSLGFGVTGILTFRTQSDSLAKPSSIQNIFIYTLEKQIIFYNPFDIFLKKDNVWISGEIGYFVYPYEFYGFGTTLNDPEFYTANFFRFEGNLLNKIAPNLYAGPTMRFDNYFKIDTDPDGELYSQQVLGIDQGKLLGLGASFILDKRNNLFSPYKGYYLSGDINFYEDKVLGDYNFMNISFDARKYFYLDDSWETGFQLVQQSVIGDIPFYNYSQLGGSNIMRGYYKGAYRDHHYTAVQTEIRHKLMSNILGKYGIYGSAFAALGSVSDQFMSYDKVLGSYGAGLRLEIDPKDRLRLRVDYARGNGTSGFYLNINEAF
ncbi:MAG: hypothetical protein ACJAVY_002031 [Marinoscillum sp.]|jgi:hypothetical protein